MIEEGIKSIGLMKGDPDEAARSGAYALFFPCGLGHMMGSMVKTKPGSRGRARRSDLKPNCVLLGCPLYPTHTSPKFSMS